MNKLEGVTIRIPLGTFRDDCLTAWNEDPGYFTQGEIKTIELLYQVYGSKYEITIGAYEMAAILKAGGFSKK